MAVNALVLQEAVELFHAVEPRPAPLPDVGHEQLQLLATELVEGHQLGRHRHREPISRHHARRTGTVE